jgi:hypothetical protein
MFRIHTVLGPTHHRDGAHSRIGSDQWWVGGGSAWLGLVCDGGMGCKGRQPHPTGLKLLSFLPNQLLADDVIIIAVAVEFDDVLGGLAGHVERPPAFSQDFVDDHLILI